MKRQIISAISCSYDGDDPFAFMVQEESVVTDSVEPDGPIVASVQAQPATPNDPPVTPQESDVTSGPNPLSDTRDTKDDTCVAHQDLKARDDTQEVTSEAGAEWEVTSQSGTPVTEEAAICVSDLVDLGHPEHTTKTSTDSSGEPTFVTHGQRADEDEQVHLTTYRKTDHDQLNQQQHPL